MKLATILTSPLRLVDGPLVDQNPRRRELVAQMAADLVKYNAVTDERDAIRSLFGRGYAMVDIVMMIDDARQAAAQLIVAKVMADG